MLAAVSQALTVFGPSVVDIVVALVVAFAADWAFVVAVVLGTFGVAVVVAYDVDRRVQEGSTWGLEA